MIEIRHLVKTYGGPLVLKDVSATIHDGETISIIGPYGNGKSTLLRCLNLLETPTCGDILFHGKSILAPDFDPASLRTRIGMVFKSINLFPHLSALDNILLAPLQILHQDKQEAKTKALQLLELIGLSNKAYSFPDELTAGQRQRIAIARALALNPEVLLLDEPTSMLDPTMVNEVLAVIRKLAANHLTMLIVTHDMNFAREISSRVFYLDDGIIYEEGTAQEIFGNPQKIKTRAFLKRKKMKSFSLKQADFDLYHFQSEVDDFAERQLLSATQRYALRLVLEELLVNIIFHQTNEVNVAIGISEENNTTDITLSSDGITQDPLTTGDPDYELSRAIIQENCSDITFIPGSASSPGELRLGLKS